MQNKITVYLAAIILVLTTLSNAYALQLKSPDFNDNAAIPAPFTCDGNNQAPRLHWQDIPKDTQSFALIAADPDAPAGTWYHWLVFNIPAKIHQLPSQDLTNIKIGNNSWQHKQYDGPCPPKGQTHRYIFTLYALDIPLELPNGIQASDLLLAMQNHILATATWQGTYKH